MPLIRSNNKNIKVLYNNLIAPLYIIFNICILIHAHSSISHAKAPDSFTNPTTCGSEDSNNCSMIKSILNSTIQFFDRMKKNGVDDIILMDLLFCGCVVLLGLELVSVVVLKVAGCKCRLSSIKLF